MSDTPARRFHDGSPLSLYTWPPDRLRYAYTHLTEFLPHTVIARGSGLARELPSADAATREQVARTVTETSWGRMPLADLVARTDTELDGLLVLVGGRIAFEAYPRMAARDLHVLWSVSKALTGLAVAVAAARGLVDPIQPVGSYIPALSASAWAEVRVRDVLDMASGIDCRETEEGAFTTPGHPYRVYEEAIGYLPAAGGAPPSVFEHLAELRAVRPPGEAYEYSSADTFVLGWLVEEVTRTPLSEFLSTEIWSRIGAERDAVGVISPHGGFAGCGGISTTLRDLARFGLLYTEDGRGVIPPGHLETVRSTGRPEVWAAGDGADDRTLYPDDLPLSNAWQWDRVWADGDLYKGGWGGQGLHVSPASRVVVAFFGTPDVARLPDGDPGRIGPNRFGPVARQVACALR